ncbi:MAG: chemotaxis protein CheA [Nitrospiraceae bacterium]|nr:chemotaxis protein CheA [Nitrospiraceae bacterium]
MSSTKNDFIAEAEDLLEEAGRLILEIQDTYQTGLNPDNVNGLFRAIHTLKGISGVFGQQSISELSHSFESLLDDIRLGKIEISEEAVRFLFSNMDILRSLISGLTEGKQQDVSGHIKSIEVFKNSQKGTTKGPELKGLIDESLLMVLSEYEEARLKVNLQEGKGIYIAKAIFVIDGFDKELELITQKIKSKGELVSTLPTSSDIPPDSIGFNLMFGSAYTVEKLKEEINVDIDVLIPSKKALEPISAIQKPQETVLKSATTTVRVDIEKLDRILNTIGELTLAKGAIKRINDELTNLYGRTRVVNDVFKIYQTLEKRLAELQSQVLEIRMVTIGQIFSRLSQVIRKYSREINKKIELVMYGEDTEIDKYIAEEVVDPLMHIVKNSIDHGIEPETERIKKGKRDVGTIILKASQRGNHVVIEVKDDGGGIDVERVKNKAIALGLINKDDQLDENSIIDIIFTPGFSTKDTATEISGRGVGMDVVRNKLTAIGGYAEIETEKDKGTVIILTIPITLAIVKSLLIRVGEMKYAIPLTSIVETVSISRNELQTVEGKEVYNLRGEMLPITNIARMFNIKESDSDKVFIVVIEVGNRKYGLIVDELFGQHEIVIKSLGGYFEGHRGFAGAAEIGKHEVVLVIDVDALIAASVIKQKTKSS